MSDSLQILSYNIWFDGGFHKPSSSSPPSQTAPPNESIVDRGKRLLQLDKHAGAQTFQTRMAAVIDILIASHADVICLQEVTAWSHELITTHPTLSHLYEFSNNPMGRYGVLALALKSRHPTFQTIAMPTCMGRDLLAVQIVVGENIPCLVCTAHFESLASAPVRKEQLQVAASLMHPCANSVLCGDFNFCSYRNYAHSDPVLENKVLAEIMPNHLDLWSTLVWPKGGGGSGEERPSTPTWQEKGWTFDSERNHNIRQQERMRYDRVLSHVQDLHPVSIDIVGDVEIEDGPRVIHPSDHFGLLATFEVVA